VAFNFDFPHISNVTELSSITENEISGVFEMDGYENTFRAQLPLTMSVTRKLNDPRLATKIQILKVPMKKVITTTVGALGISSEEDEGPQAHFDSYTSITKERKKVILSGEPDEMVQDLIQKIEEENVL
jgi:electron transfer flavoprotein beta subunit